MKSLVCIVIVILLAFALRPVSAESPAQLPQKLVEQMEALPAKFKEIEQSIQMGKVIDKAQYEEIDKINEKIAKIESLIAKPHIVKQATKPVPAPSKPVSVASGTYSQPDGYKSQWTYPGDIATHAATVHGISVAGKSKEQLEREHDAAHNATVTRSVVVQRPQMVRSNCPGGVCPTQVSRTRTWQPIIRRR